MQASIRLVLALLTGAALPVAAQAQKLNPGLWEMQTSMKSGDGRMQESMARMQKELANLPPEQRKMMQDMMAKQGVGIDPAKGLQAMRLCLSKEQAERDEWPTDPNGSCKYERVQRSGATTRFAFSCSNPKASGEGEATVHSAKSYSSRMSSQLTDKDGKVVRTDMQQQARWLGADCGTVKPMPAR